MALWWAADRCLDHLKLFRAGQFDARLGAAVGQRRNSGRFPRSGRTIFGCGGAGRGESWESVRRVLSSSISVGRRIRTSAVGDVLSILGMDRCGPFDLQEFTVLVVDLPKDEQCSRPAPVVLRRGALFFYLSGRGLSVPVTLLRPNRVGR